MPTIPAAPAADLMDRLASAIDAAGSPICIGIDPVLDRLPDPLKSRHADAASALEAFSIGVIDAAVGVAPAVKFQSACYERFGSPGLAVLEDAIDHARDAGLFVLIDAKRGDIGITAEHYAAAAANAGADAITLNSYLGVATARPFLDQGLAVFLLVRTSNPEGDSIQTAKLADGRTVAELVASEVATLGAPFKSPRGLSRVGAVVGATKSADGATLRMLMPDQVFLVPGYGAQGGTADNVRALLRPGATSPGDRGVLVTASRSVIYPPSAPDWRLAIRDAAARFAGEIRTVLAP